MLRSLLKAWLEKTAKAKMREAVVQAAKGEGTQTSAIAVAPPPKACHLGFVFALGMEAGCFEDTLQGLVKNKANGFVIYEGGLRGQRVAIILAGPGQANAARATEMLIDGHKPQRVVSAGFAGGFCPQLKRNDILIAERLRNLDGDELSLDIPEGLAGAVGPDVHRGTLLTVGGVVRLPSEKRSLHEQFGAMAVDMETFAVAKVCRRCGVAISSIRVINDTAGEQLPKDVDYLLSRKTNAARWGAALGTAFHRPASVKDMYQLRENALVASGRLAKFLARIPFD